MQLEPGYRLRVAPRFHSPTPWADRVCLGATAWQDGRPLPETAWRPATGAELSVLLAEDAAGAEQDFSVFTVPDRLRALWWELAGSSDTPDIEPLARAVAEFAHFKGLPLPGRCVCDVVLTPPGQALIGAGGTAAGSEPAAGINLGDERTAVVLLNLPPSRLRELLDIRSRDEGSGEPLSGWPLARRFLSEFPTYPLLRLSLEPGEGVWVPPGGEIWHGHTAGKQEIDVWFVIRRARPA
jgi:hypothetical protein